MKHTINGQKLIAVICAVFMLFTLAGCGSGKTIVLTTCLKDNQIFQVENMYCTKPEMMVYLTNIQNSYEVVYGKDVWNTGSGDATLEDNLKETVLARISRVKVLNLLADDLGLELTKEQKELAKEAAKTYYNSLNKVELKALDIDEKTICQMYEEYCLAEEVYKYLIKDVNPEISDDEARSVTLEQIVVKNYHEDREGNITPYSDEMKQNSYMKIKEAKAKLELGDSFDNVVLSYNQDSKSTLTFHRGEVDKDLEDLAFSMDTGEITDIIERDDCYVIYKCVSAFNKDETELNRKEMLDLRKEEAFYEEYDTFLNSLTGNLNEKQWSELTLIHEDAVTTCSFFDIYEDTFK